MKNKKTRDTKIICTVMVLAMFIAYLISGGLIIHIANTKDNEMMKLNEKIYDLETYKDTLSEAGCTVDSLRKQIDDLDKQLEDKKSELDSIEKSISEKQTTLDQMSYEVDLINKYNYALYDTEGKRNDITLDMLKYVETECASRGLDPNLVFGIIMVESEGHAGVTNSSSGAAGLGQFMPATGEFIATNYLDLSYDHSITPYDGNTNIAMIIEYLCYLYDKYYGDTISVIKEYCGGDLNYAYNYYNKVLNASKIT